MRRISVTKGPVAMTLLGTGKKDELWKHVSELAGSSAFLLYLSDASKGRMTIPQAAFFMAAATADVLGSPKTRTQVLEEYEGFNHSIRKSYRLLMEPTIRDPDRLGWLTSSTNPYDVREKHLLLTEVGRSVVAGSISAQTAFLKGKPE